MQEIGQVNYVKRFGCRCLDTRDLKARAKAFGLLLSVGLLVMACNRSNAPTATSIPPLASVPTVASATVEAAPTVSMLPTVTTAPTFEVDHAIVETPNSSAGRAIGIASQGAIFSSPRYSYTVVLPCCWLALPTPGTALETAIDELEAESDLPLWGDLGARVRERDIGAVLELIALLPDEENPATPLAQVTVSVLPTNGLTLDDYMTATADELNRIANTSVLTAVIEPALGVGALPASVIQYTAAPAPQTVANAEQTMAGLQVAFFGYDDNSLIVLTFTTTSDRYDELVPQFLHIVRTVTLDDPAV
jgi:hypothetical protein